MNEKSTAIWQIRNEVYPITPIPLECIVERIAVIEKFFVHLTRTDSSNANATQSSGQFDYSKAASGKMTVAKWRETRFAKSFPMLSAQVVDTNGRILADDEMISAARGDCESDSNSVLIVTAWSDQKPHDDDEALLKVLERELLRFRFLAASEIQCPQGCWKIFRRCKLKVQTKPLNLRRYERRIIVRLLTEAIKKPGFECDVFHTFQSSVDSDQQSFSSQYLNEIWKH